MTNEFEAAVASTMQADTAQAARTGFVSAVDTNPDAYAEAQRVARRTGVPVDTALNMPAEMKRQDRVGSIDFDTLAKTSPVTAGLLADVEKARVAHDDVENMSKIEAALYSFGKFEVNSARALASGVPGFNEGMWGVAQSGAEFVSKYLTKPLTGTLLPEDIGGKAAGFFSTQRLASKATRESLMPQADGILSSGWYSGLQSMAQNLLTLPAAAITGNPELALVPMVATTGGQAYGQARDKGIDIENSLVFASSQAAIEYATEKLPVSWLIKDMKAGTGFGKMLGWQMIGEVPGEQIATVLQDLNEWAILNPEKPFSSYLAERPSAAAQTLIATLVGTGGQVSTLKLVDMAINGAQQKDQQAEHAAAMGQLLTNLNEMAQASALVMRDTETAQGFFQSALQEGREAVYITPDALAQSGLADKMAQAIPAVAEQLATAAETGHDIRIPIADLMTTMAGPELEQSIIPHLADEPGGFTATTAQEYMQSDRAKELQNEVERVLAEKEGDATFKQSTEAVKSEIRAQLDTAGRFTPQVNDAYASMVSNFYAVMGARLGLTSQDLFARYPLRVAAERIAGEQFDQAGKLKTDTPEFRNWFGDSKVVDSGGKPLVVYHGGTRWNSADLAAAGRDSLWLSEEFTTAVSYADQYGKKDAEIKPLYVKMAKPLDLREADVVDSIWPEEIVSDKDLMHDRGRIEQAIEFAKSNGFDGLIHPDTTSENRGGGISYVVFSPTQIKAATLTGLESQWDSRDIDIRSEGNNGQFNPNDPNILHQGGNAFQTVTPEQVEKYRAEEQWETTDEENGFPVWANKHVALAAPRDVTDGHDVFYIAPEGARAVKYEVRNPQGEVVGHAVLEITDGWPTMLLDIETKEEQRGNRYAEHAVAAIANDAGELGIWHIVPEARSWWERQGVAPVDQYDGTLTFAGYADARASRENPRGLGANVGQYNQAEDSNRGSFNPATLSITLLKDADLSTFLHESGHFFLEVMTDIAARSDAPAMIQKDMGALLDWFGLKSLDEWHNLTFEEKRSYHEKFARGFEAYLFEGNAPSIELQGLFQRFRAWMLNLYRDLKSLNVELTDEVRGVFDRMLASTEQITLAEQGRSMMPLFTSAEQAGMTPEEFADYQALGVDATNEAIEDLQARGLRDMQWIHNARGRLIKKMQKEAAAQRAEVQMEVRREVMAQPIYRAWQFLTGKQTADDKIQPIEPPKSDPNVLDETQDSLFVAVAKLGGLSKSDVTATWGVDPADKPQSGVFGKPVWRIDGGLSLDAMAEQLAQYGYLNPDENGKVDLADFERMFDDELRGSPQYSNAYDPGQFNTGRPGDQVANLGALAAGRLDRAALAELGIPEGITAHLDALRMVKKGGIHPDIVAEMFGFTSGDELVRKLAAAESPKAEIEALTDVRMLEQFGELSSPEAIEKAADKAIHNDVRARMISTELNALAKATGQRKVLASAAKEYAAAMIARLKVRDIKPGQYASAEVRAAKAAAESSKSGDLATAAAEKRNQLINNYATRAAYDAKGEVDTGLRYFKKFSGDIKGLDVEYADQIAALLERFDLRKGQSNKAVDKRTALADWIRSQRDQGLEPSISLDLENEAFRTSYKNMTVEEFRGLLDAVKQIEHLGRLKHKLLTARDQRAYEAVRDEIVASIHEHAQGRTAETRTPTTNMGRAVQGLKRFWASHIKAATWARVMDGGKDGGPMWEYFVRVANERGDMETSKRAKATAELSRILAPIFALGKMGGKGQYFPTLNRSLNRESRIAIALNWGNESNRQRLVGGEGWNPNALLPVLQSLTAQEWRAVQAVWDHFESYRPEIAAKERRIYGKEPEWVAPIPFTITAADGQEVSLRGGYYPIKYDPAASQRAEEHADAEGAKRQLQGAYTTATTRRSFTKSRVEEVNGRPLLYTLAGLYSGVNDVIHDLAWHEWLIDTNRLLRSNSIDSAIRTHYGPEAKQQFKTWAADIAEGEKAADAALDIALSRLRQGVSAAGLGFNVMSALIQPLGITQSITRVGAGWVGRGVMKYISSPIDLTREVNAKSSFMENRARTRFRELNELRNQVQDQSAAKELIGRYAYFLMMRCQQMVDVPTWWGAYEKAIAEGNDDTRAIELADQAVIDSQGGGQTKDLSSIERGGPAQRLFTVFYSFMNTALNLGVEKTMSADTPAKKAKLAVDYAMLYVVPAILGYFLKAALTPGDSGDDDPEKLAKKLAANQIDYLMGLMVVVREFGEAAKLMAGANDMGRDYTGPAGLRLIADTVSLAKQAHQGEFDDAFRKAAVNVTGDMFGLPSAQINRTITGTKALAEGKTENPAAVAFGFQEKR